MEFKSRYKSHTPDEQGYVIYAKQDNETWATLYRRQIDILPGRACEAYMNGLSVLNLSTDQMPQLPDVNKKLHAATGWQVAPVAALISAEAFFELLANRQFPSATFIRVPEELDYVQEPDIFHEIFGHCPLLTDPVYADFLQDYAKMVLSFDKSDWPLLQRLFWFTVEFGLVKTEEGIRAYGGGILSSIAETAYSVESNIPRRILFNTITALRTPYRIDQKQVNYFVIASFEELYELLNKDLKQAMTEARQLGEFKPDFEIDKDNPSVHLGFC